MSSNKYGAFAGKGVETKLTLQLQNGIPTKGAILTLISAKWFEVLSSRVPGLKHHFLHLGPPETPGLLTQDERQLLRGRSMTVRYDFESGVSLQSVDNTNLVCLAV